MTLPEPVHALAIGAHPDDVELCAGGLLAKLTRAGYRVAAVDLTRGERASRGTVAEREEEAQRAAQILGLVARENLGLPDAGLQDAEEYRRAVATVLRKYRPALVLTHHWEDRHPDHAAASLLVSAAAFLARLPQVELGYPAHSIVSILYFPHHELVVPTLVVDISEVFEVKMEALRAYRSQFQSPMPEGYRFIGASDYERRVQASAAYFGAYVGVAYGEPYLLRQPLKVSSAEWLGKWLLE